MTGRPGSSPPIGIVPIDPPADRDAIALATGASPTAMPPERWFALRGLATVRNVGAATLTPVLPRGGGTGAAVIVAAGGGYLIQSMENEAWAQARWLADRGIAAFILKYRLQPTPADDAAFGAALVERFTTAAAAANLPHQTGAPDFMVADAAAAMRLVRERAGEWAVDPGRVGYLGFSAGAMIGLGLVDAAEATTMPAFVAAIYPSMVARAVRADAPPLFVAMAVDDQLYGRQGYGLAEAWNRAGRSVELHVYAKGGHGFGMGMPGTTSTGSMGAFHAWLACGGWLGTREETAP